MKARADRGVGRDGLVGVLLALAVAAPVLAGIAYSAAASAGIVGAGAGNASTVRIARVLADPATWAGLVLSIGVAAMATTLATVAAVTVAVVFRGTRFTDRIGLALAALPLPLPQLVAAALGVWVLGQSGLLARLAFAGGWLSAPADMPALVYDRWGIGLMLTMAWKETAFLSVVASALLATRTSAAEEAAHTLGAGAWATFRRVTWPVLWRGLLPAVLSVFIFVAGSYEAAALLAPSAPLVLPLAIADRAADPDLTRRGDAYVLTLLLLGIAIVAVAAHEWARARWEPLAE
ncbi:MAG: ABC transporter permease subunit [Gemmatimonadota bacterium]|nr:ABC transporter permease subunit [Gemmatimonadota bacterium]